MSDKKVKTSKEKKSASKNVSSNAEGDGAEFGEARKVNVDDFQKIKLIGRGNVGKVYVVRSKLNEKLYAMKVLTKEEMIRRNKVRSRRWCLCMGLSLSALHSDHEPPSRRSNAC